MSGDLASDSDGKIPEHSLAFVVSSINQLTSDLYNSIDKKSGPPSATLKKQSDGTVEVIFQHLIPIANTQHITVNSEDMCGFFGSIWESLVDAIFEDNQLQGVITCADFTLVCRYLTKARIDHVYAKCVGQLPTGRIPLPTDLEVPKFLADVLNGLGRVLINGDAFNVIPVPETPPDDNAQALSALVTTEMLSQFSSLVMTARTCNIIHTSFLSDSVDGSAWWLLSARVHGSVDKIAQNIDSVEVQGVFKEWKHNDAYTCAVVQRGNDGLIPDLLVRLTWSFRPILGVGRLRRSFSLHS